MGTAGASGPRRGTGRLRIWPGSMNHESEERLIATLTYLEAFMSALSDAVTANTESVAALTAIVAATPSETAAAVTSITASTVAVDAATTALGGTPPTAAVVAAPVA